LWTRPDRRGHSVQHHHGPRGPGDEVYDGLDPNDVSVTNLDDEVPIIIFSDDFE